MYAYIIVHIYALLFTITYNTHMPIIVKVIDASWSPVRRPLCLTAMPESLCTDSVHRYGNSIREVSVVVGYVCLWVRVDMCGRGCGYGTHTVGVYIYVCVCICVRMCVYMYAYVFVCMHSRVLYLKSHIFLNQES